MNITIPVPQSPIGTVEQASGRIIMSREWYRYFGLLQTAVGGSTSIINEIVEQSTSPVEEVIGATLGFIADAVVDVSSQVSQARGLYDGLLRRVGDLEMLSQSPPELGEMLKTLSTVKSGRYTPTLTSVLNLDATTAFECRWFRVADMVSVSGRLNADPTAAGAVELGISLPIASNFTSANTDCNGVAADGDTNTACDILADTANDRASLTFIATSTVSTAILFHFTYQILT